MKVKQIKKYIKDRTDYLENFKGSEESVKELLLVLQFIVTGGDNEEKK